MSQVPLSPQELREKSDPYELDTAIPVPVLLLVATMIVFGMFYILASAPDERAELGDHRTVADLAPKAGDGKAAAADGAATFAARCASCHQASGLGVPGVFPPLAGSEWVNGKPELFARIVLHGVQGPLTVKGVSYDGAMPAFKEQLDDATLAAVATYVRSQWGNAAAPLTAQTVADARTRTAARTGPWGGEAELAALR